ncbi:hypothetical protein ASD32_26390 [Rhizobium sp. Root483D2]|nr:hypothetical protein ASD32_26390 [Rhizobium sp. Root483D2]
MWRALDQDGFVLDVLFQSRRNTKVVKRQSAAERVVHDGHRAGAIVASIRAMAQRSPVRMERTDVGRVLQDVLFLMRKELHSRGLQFVTDMTTGPVHVLGDRAQL